MTIMKSNVSGLLAGVSLSMVAAVQGVQAQETDSDTASPARSGEIIVYAQKKAESVQDVPVSVTAVSAETIANSFSTDLTDIGFIAPNVQLQGVSTFPGFANFSIRGLGNSTSIRTLDPSVNVVQDGMVLATQIGAVLDLFDVEAVEVLRGPQGVFQGRNTTGGAVLLRTGKPSNVFGGSFRAGYGSYDTYRIEGIVEGPLSNQLSAKLAVQYKHSDGAFKDKNGGFFAVAPQNPSGTQPDNPMVDQPGQDSIFIKPTVTFDSGAGFDFTVYGQYYKDNGGGTASRMFLGDGAPGTTVAQFGYTPPEDPYEINHDLIGDSRTESWHVIGEGNIDVGPGVLTSITAFRDLSFDSSLDVDGTPFLLIHFPDNEEGADQFTQELRYAADISDSLDFLVGFFYMKSEMNVIERREFSGLTARRAHTDFNYIQSDWTQEQESVAGFANFNFKPTPEITLSAGARYSWEKKELDISPLAGCAGPGFTNCSTTRLFLEDSWTNWSPRAGIEYEPNPNLLTYFTWTRGYRSGNFNARASSLETIAAADPEQADQFELGLKSDLANGAVRLNLAAFWTEYDEIQRVTNEASSTGQPVQRLRNAASATIKGLEAEFTIQPSDNFWIDGSLAWIDPEFNTFTGLDLDGDGVVSPADEAAAAELDFDRVPSYTAYIAANFQFGVGGLPGEFTFRPSLSYRSGFPTDVNNSPIFFQEAYELVDVSLRYETGQYRLAAFARNVFDKHYADILSPAFNAQAFGGAPVSWGIEFGYDF
ncbi:TonB-dependent receptor [Altererythrobacter sp. MF3-039]|uniref:TonB-dependent receptor n=1 Tax=Altererythrobacter sp. MF3-039 TaxID=3252901 RepID=UPI00390C774C